MIRAALMVVVLVVLAGCAGDTELPDTDGARPDQALRSSTPAPPPCERPCYGPAEHLGNLSPDVVVEPSGMAASKRNAGVYYVVSDEPGTSGVAAVREDGTLVARVEVEGMAARNAEALAVGPCAGHAVSSCLYVGDIGDHVGRDDVVVYRVPEPDLASLTGSVPADGLRFTYPDGPTDAEAMFVDRSGRPLIVSKASFDRASAVSGPTRLYRGRPDGGVLELVGEIDLPEPSGGVFAALVGNVVTDASYRDGEVLLRTYDDVWEYRTDDPSADVVDFPGWPVRQVPSPGQIQSEIVAHLADGCGYLTTSEMTGSIDAVRCAG